MQKIWVIGSEGQLGFYLKERSPNSLLFSRADLDLEKTHLIEENLNKALKEFRPDYLINASAYTKVDLAETERASCQKINVDAPAKMAHWSKQIGARFFHISTDYVYSGLGDKPWTETDEVSPLNFYGLSKLTGERAVLEENSDALIFRTSWVYSHRRENFVLAILKRARTQNFLKVVDDQVGSPTYADHLAEFLLTLAGCDPSKALKAPNARKEAMGKTVSGVYHFADGGYVSRLEFAREILRQASQFEAALKTVEIVPAKTADFPAPAERPLNSRLSLESTQDTFGDVIKPWQQGLTSCLKRIYLAPM